LFEQHLEALEETLEILADQQAVKELREAEHAVAAGDVIRGTEGVGRLRSV
jgi:hypothetical protein